MNRHPLHWATLAAHQCLDRRTARRRACASTVVLFALIAAGALGLAFTVKFLGL